MAPGGPPNGTASIFKPNGDVVTVAKREDA